MRIIDGRSIIVAGFILAVAPAVPAKDRARAQAGTGQGLSTATYETDRGRVVVNLPDDLAAGDVITGTVVAEPAGKTEKDRGRNVDVLQGYVVEVEDARTTVAGRVLKWAIPAALAGGAVQAVLKDEKGRELGRAEIPVQAPPAGAARPTTIGPYDFTPPVFGQAGRPLSIAGPFDGDFGTTALTIGGRPASLLAESPRKLVAESPRDLLGPATLDLKEGGAGLQTDYRGISQSLSAKRTELLKDESAVVNDRIEGLQDLQCPIEIRLENRTPGTVRLDGGDVQTIMLHPESAGPDGVATVARTVTGIRPGAFSIAATVLPQPAGGDRWHVLKELADSAEDFGRFIDSVKKDLDAYSAQGGMKKSEAEDIKGRLDACREQARTDLDAAKRCADLVLRPIEVVRVAAKLWLMGFDLYKLAIKLIVDSLAEEEGKVPYALINKALDFVIEGAKAAGDKEGAQMLRDAKALKEKVEKGQEALSKLKEAMEKLEEYTPKPKK